MNVVWHHFHSFDEHAVLLCRGVENVLESLLHFANKDFAAVLRAEDDELSSGWQAHLSPEDDSPPPVSLSLAGARGHVFLAFCLLWG